MELADLVEKSIREIAHNTRITSRNSRCTCGSGKKYKRCCMLGLSEDERPGIYYTLTAKKKEEVNRKREETLEELIEVFKNMSKSEIQEIEKSFKSGSFPSNEKLRAFHIKTFGDLP